MVAETGLKHRSTGTQSTHTAHSEQSLLRADRLVCFQELDYILREKMQCLCLFGSGLGRGCFSTNIPTSYHLEINKTNEMESCDKWILSEKEKKIQLINDDILHNR